MLEPRALIFDFDGTLADTMPIHFEAWQATMSPYGITFTEERFYALGGTPTDKIIALLAGEANIVIDVARAAHEKEMAFAERLTEIQAIEPVRSIAEAHRGHIPMAVATGGFRWVVEKSLDYLAMADWFDALVTAEDVSGHKPEPDVFLEAARRIGVAPAHCRAYEDTDIGVEAARRAGMDVVDVRPMYRAWRQSVA